MGSVVRLDLKAFFADDRKKAVIFVHPAVHKTVKDVQEYIKSLYELDVQDVQLLWDGFHLPERAGVRVLLESCPHMIEVKLSTTLPHSLDETIVLDEDQHQEFLKDHQHQVLMDDDNRKVTQSEGQEAEYFDELDQQQLEDNELKTEDDEDRFIIEEIQLEENDLMYESDETITPDCEYIMDDADQHNLSGDMNDELHYALEQAFM